MKVKVKSCPTLCDPVDYNLSGSSVHGIFQARVLQWIAISFSRGSSQPRNQSRVSCIAGRCFTIWATREAPCSMVDWIQISMQKSTASQHAGSNQLEHTWGKDGKESACNAGDPGLIPVSGRSPGGGERFFHPGCQCPPEAQSGRVKVGGEDYWSLSLFCDGYYLQPFYDIEFLSYFALYCFHLLFKI